MLLARVSVKPWDVVPTEPPPMGRVRTTGPRHGLRRLAGSFFATRQCVIEGCRRGVALGSGPDPPTRTGRDTGAPVVVIRLRPGS